MLFDQPTLEQHCMALEEEESVVFCNQAIDKRLNSDSGVLLIQNLFELCVRDQFLSDPLPSAFGEHFSSINIMDSTEWKLPASLAAAFPGFNGDGTQSCTQVQFDYDVLSGKLIDLSIGDARIADSAYATPLLDNIKSKALVIRDLGYSRIKSFKKIEAQQAYYISRLNPNINLYERKGNGWTPLTYKTILKRLKGTKKSYLDIPVYLGQEKYPVRLTANLLSKDAAERRRHKKIYKRNTKPEKYNYLRKMNLFITNVPKEILSSQQVYNLYRVRWQIELVFKAWKSVLKINKVRKMKANRFRCYLLGKLLWIVLNWEIYSVFNVHVFHSTGNLLSIYKCFTIMKGQARCLLEILLHRKAKLEAWLDTLYHRLSKFGRKKSQKGKVDVVELLELLTIKKSNEIVS
jgi:hypothetical protein